MKKDYVMELLDFLNNYSKNEFLTIIFECHKLEDGYHLKAYDKDSNLINQKIVETYYVNNFFENNDRASREEILSVIHKPGPKLEL